MQNILQELLARVENGETFAIGFETRSMRIGDDFPIIKGVVQKGYELPKCSDSIKELERLYMEYKYSRPTEFDMPFNYFKPLKESEMTDEELFMAPSREVARAELEFHVLNMILNGCKWSDITNEKNWFWESRNVEGLVLLKDWFTEMEAA